jgi:hypothetical protein
MTESAGQPPLARSATLTVTCRSAGGAPAGAVVERAPASLAVTNPVWIGFPVDVRRA